MSLATTYGSLACSLSFKGWPASKETGLYQHPRSRRGHQEAHSPLTTQRSVSDVHRYLPKRVSGYLQQRLRMCGPSASTQCRTSDPVQDGRTGVAKKHPSKSRCIVRKPPAPCSGPNA
ncbi:hypothetical protein CGRA01v4_11923 [Colletotrichum graminicola]|nr:hypothetical protein CGRA01v4_11923 [Colletotrichum graminicola]